MNHLILSLLGALVLALPLQSQADADTADSSGPFRVTLAAQTPSVAAGAIATLQMTLQVERDCEVDNTLLSGHWLEAYVGESKKPEVKKVVPGKTPLLAGTHFTRPIQVDTKLVLGGDSVSGVATLTLRWPGFEGAEAQVSIIPDQSKIDVSKLDLTKTRVRLVTSHGDMLLSFRPDKAPNHVANFVTLSRDGFYNGTQFHRVIRGFMIQGGCPYTKPAGGGRPGTGGSGKMINAEFNDIRHVKGVLSAARTNDPNSHSSQFFIVHNDAQNLDNQYTAFGKLEEGFETLDRIANTPVRQTAPIKPVHLRAAIVIPVYK